MPCRDNNNNDAVPYSRGSPMGFPSAMFSPAVSHRLTASRSSLVRALSSAASETELAQHYRKLSRMYRLAPVNAEERYHSRVSVGPRKAVVTAPVRAGYTHSAGGLHGSSYFKMLDDAAFFV